MPWPGKSPVDQVFHPYANMGTPNMTNSVCRHALLLPADWHAQLARDFPYGIVLKVFYDICLVPLQAVVGQPYADVLTWWRHATTRTTAAGAWACLGLQVSTAQAPSPGSAWKP